MKVALPVAVIVLITRHAALCSGRSKVNFTSSGVITGLKK